MESIKLRKPCRSFTTSSDGLRNVLTNHISLFSPNIKKALKQKVNAVWDTGATDCVINEKLAKELNLIPVSMKKMQTANGENICEVYLLSIYLPNGVFVKDIQVLSGKMHDKVDFLVGMNVINLGDFVVSNKDGKTSFSFRIPSLEKIDFVKNSRIINSFREKQTISPKALCPCGSGKQFKDCCMNKNRHNAIRR